MADILSIASGLIGGGLDQMALQFEARQESIAAQGERIAGEADALTITQAANEALATNIARSFGSGGRIATGGSNEAIIKQTLTESSFARRVARRSGEQRAQVRRAQSQQLRTQGQLAIFSSFIKAGGQATQSQRLNPRDKPPTTTTRATTGTGGSARARFNR